MQATIRQSVQLWSVQYACAAVFLSCVKSQNVVWASRCLSPFLHSCPGTLMSCFSVCLTASNLSALLETRRKTKENGARERMFNVSAAPVCLSNQPTRCTDSEILLYLPSTISRLSLLFLILSSQSFPPPGPNCLSHLSVSEPAGDLSPSNGSQIELEEIDAWLLSRQSNQCWDVIGPLMYRGLSQTHRVFTC